MCTYNNYALDLKQGKPLEDIVGVLYEVNKKLNRLETRERKIFLESKPTSLMAILTTKCNLRCIMCSRVRGAPETLPFDLIKKIYASFPYLGLIDWQGGEVFLVDYFKELFVRAATYPHILQHITTNGLLIDEEWARIFAESNVNLLYSIDSPTKDTYENIRLGATFEDLLRGIDIVNETKNKYNSYRNNRLELRATIMRCNYKTLHLFPDFCKRYNFSSLTFDLLIPDVIPCEDIVGKPDFDAILYLNDTIPMIENECRENNIDFKCTFSGYIKKTSQEVHNKPLGNLAFFELGAEDEAFKTDCSYPWKRLHIETDGRVYPACQCKQSVGDLKNDSFEEIWNGSGIQLYRKLLSNNEAGKICSQTCFFCGAVGRTEEIDVPE